jgi:molecular chaperone HtpG
VTPYRTVDREERAEAPRDQGIVGDVVAQFADPLAFYRELVQNSIDAGTPTVEVRLVYDAPGAVMRAQVRDRGEGMSREVVENQLLVLFRSTKEKDPTKIGKFGIGFKSVLAPKPNIVVVQTSRAGRRLTLHLHPDLTYELYDAGPATQSGTSVELELALAEDKADEFVRQSHAALVRWCRHATVPIEFHGQLLSGEPVTGRIDRPLALDGALVEVRDTTDEGRLTCVVGLVAGDTEPSTGFFNHGLMLHESDEPLIGRLAVKIQDSRLGHTLSRDNVRRDERYDHAVGYARTLAETRLVPAVARELAARAERGDLPAYYQLVAAIEEAHLELRPTEWVFPVIGDAKLIRATDLPRRAWAAPHPSPLTEVLAARSIPVLHMSAASRNWLVSRASRSASAQVVEVSEELTAVELVPLEDRDHAWLGLLTELLDAAYRRPASIALARLHGLYANQLVLAGGVGDSAVPVAGANAPFVLDRDRALRQPFGKLVKLPLLLSVTHPFVVSARAGDPRVAASHLARLILIAYGKLDVERSQRLFEHTLDRLGVA